MFFVTILFYPNTESLAQITPVPQIPAPTDPIPSPPAQIPSPVLPVLVPTDDKPNNIKESLWDRVAHQAANTLIEQTLVSMTNWINSGFDGGPAFVTDLRGFLLDIADATTADFIEGTALEALCSPWRLNIRVALALGQATPFEREVRCTLSDIVANMDDFINGDFSQGGWAGWFELTTRPQNNPYGLYLITASELDQ